MGVIDILFGYKPFYDIFALFSLVLEFNEDVNYSKITKRWILIKKNKLFWNHKYAELKHVINNVILREKHTDNPPLYIHSQNKLTNLILKNASKYEKFTSDIVNKIFERDISIQKIRIFHCKNIRNSSTEDLPLVSLQVIDSYRNNKQEIYRLSDSKELTSIYDFIMDIDVNTYIVGFTDWRDLYRMGVSFYNAKFLSLSASTKIWLHCLNFVGMYSIVITGDTMYSTDLLQFPL